MAASPGLLVLYLVVLSHTSPTTGCGIGPTGAGINRDSRLSHDNSERKQR